MDKNLNKIPNLNYLNLNPKEINYQLNVPQLIEESVKNNEGCLTDTGALAVDTGKFTGRSPKDRFIVEDDITRNTVWWGDINIKYDTKRFDSLFNKVIMHLNTKNIYVNDGYACADLKFKTTIRVVTEKAFQSIFASNLFLRFEKESDLVSQPDWTIIASPSFQAKPEDDKTRQGNFTIINFTKKIILIGGSAYTGEIKKGIFSVLNFLLPTQYGVLPMHCSTNVGKNGDTAIFFGLSGTGKTTLSADPNRALIGDDEHGWSDESVFNFEGGCYAKCVDLSEEKEPQIYRAVKFGSLLENTCFFENTRKVNYQDIRKTENTRVAYPIHFIENARIPSVASTPKNIFFLTADAVGVLPPISKLTVKQAMFHFISGYTAKVAGTEAEILEPQVTFSACFGKAFLPLQPMAYANLLGQKLEQHQVNVWLINTGWCGGSYGEGSRIKLAYTRAMIKAVFDGNMNNVEYQEHPVFGLFMPKTCQGVPSEILNPINLWADKEDYNAKANKLAAAFDSNFKQFEIDA